ncbi:hypothetical protein [Nitrosomonas marina]|nr:hypothetical protein [Nitrosomonas marina]
MQNQKNSLASSEPITKLINQINKNPQLKQIMLKAARKVNSPDPKQQG